jgi:hypothetical protein
MDGLSIPAMTDNDMTSKLLPYTLALCQFSVIYQTHFSNHIKN